MKLFKILGMLSLTALMTISCHRTPEAVMITISNHNGMSATFTNYGARLTSWLYRLPTVLLKMWYGVTIP